MSHRFIKYNFFLLIISCATSVWPSDLCEPVIVPVRSEASIAQLLSGLAEDYNFNLSFPKNLDRPMRMNESMELDQLIKMLTKNMNTVLCHEKIDGCNNMRLTELSVMPVGDKTEFINVAREVASAKEYIYIDDMEQYVTDVLMKKRAAKLNEMTPEQAVEFKLLRKRLKEELKDEIAQNKKKNKQTKSSRENRRDNRQ